MKTPSQQSDPYFQQAFDAEKQLLDNIRQSLLHAQEVTIPQALSFQFYPLVSRVYISLFERGKPFIRYGSTRKNLKKTLERILLRLTEHKRFKDFSIADPGQCRILFEIVQSEQPVNVHKLKHSATDENRFIPGISGLKIKYEGKIQYFMPTDAVVHNITAVKDVLLYLSRRTSLKQRTRSISERIGLMKSEPIEYSLIEGVAFVSWQQQVYPLLMGYPMPVEFDKSILHRSILESIGWLTKNIDADGKFVYFYDAVKDSYIDIDHPKNPAYYNMLRHSGAIIALCSAYRLSRDEVYMNTARLAFKYLLNSFKEEGEDHNYQCYPMCNHRAKLGGAGISLVALLHYYRLTGDNSYRKQIDGLARHILSRIEDSGQMLSYYIHPAINDGKPLDSISEQDKEKYFSFYYPGEAMLGLALYYRYFDDLNPEFKHQLLQKSKRAMDFLIEVRPVKYKHLFQRVPDDAWLMQAIEEWFKVDGFKKQSYLDFLYHDAEAIVKYNRTYEDSPLINIGARAEGVMAAYYTAKSQGDSERAHYFIDNIILSVKGLMKTRHTEISAYAHLYPEKILGTYSFRMTNQWIRIDTIQHTACLLARLYWSDELE